MSTGNPTREAGRSSLETAAFVLLLTVIACRPFLNEMPSRTGMLRLSSALSAQSPWQAAMEGVEFASLARTGFATAVFLGATLWAVGRFRSGAKLALGGWGVLAIVFAGLSLVSAARAADRVTAGEVWLEQASFLAAAFVLAQLCRDRRRFALLVITLAAVGATMAAKGAWQVFVEIPDRVAEFREHASEQMKHIGITPGSPGAALMETRVNDPSLTGFLGLANPFASILLVVLSAGAGLAADRFISAWRHWRANRGRARAGEVPAPLLAAAILLVLAILTAATLLLTRSRGAIASAVLGACACAVVLACREWFASRWRKALLALAGVFVLGAAGTVAYGLARDRLPTLTMTFRWYYWTATGEIVRENPLWGVGGGNFPDAYLRHRRAGAEEEIKAPHNMILHSLAQFGVPGGAAYLALAGWMLFAVVRPRGRDDALSAGEWNAPGAEGGADEGAIRREGVALLAMMTLGVFFARAFLSGAATNAYVLAIEAGGPAVVLALMFGAFSWAGAGWLREGVCPGAVTRVALAGGLFAFVLHSMVEFGPWMPAPGLTFWAAAGGLAGFAAGAGEANQAGNRRVGNAITLVAVSLMLGFAVYLAWPVVEKTAWAMEAAESLARGNSQSAVAHAERYADADGRDNLAAADAARLCVAVSPPSSRAGAAMEIQQRLAQAEQWARRAVDRCPAHGDHYILLADVLWSRLDPNHLSLAAGQDAPAKAPGTAASGSDVPAASRAAQPARAFGRETNGGFDEVADALSRAAERNPGDARLRVKYARSLLLAGRAADCLAQIELARKLNEQLLAQSVVRFSPAEVEEIAQLVSRAKRN